MKKRKRRVQAEVQIIGRAAKARARETLHTISSKVKRRKKQRKRRKKGGGGESSHFMTVIYFFIKKSCSYARVSSCVALSVTWRHAEISLFLRKIKEMIKGSDGDGDGDG